MATRERRFVDLFCGLGGFHGINRIKPDLHLLLGSGESGNGVAVMNTDHLDLELLLCVRRRSGQDRAGEEQEEGGGAGKSGHNERTGRPRMACVELAHGVKMTRPYWRSLDLLLSRNCP